VQAAILVKAASGADKKLITSVNVFDLFEGPSVGEGKKSIAIEVTLQPTERTLTEEDFEALSAKIIANVKKSTGGELRG
jgi:phenylalanyl-tRNA synthetase beta chain